MCVVESKVSGESGFVTSLAWEQSLNLNHLSSELFPSPTCLLTGTVASLQPQNINKPKCRNQCILHQPLSSHTIYLSPKTWLVFSLRPSWALSRFNCKSCRSFRWFSHTWKQTQRVVRLGYKLSFLTWSHSERALLSFATWPLSGETENKTPEVDYIPQSGWFTEYGEIQSFWGLVASNFGNLSNTILPTEIQKPKKMTCKCIFNRYLETLLYCHWNTHLRWHTGDLKKRKHKLRYGH